MPRWLGTAIRVTVASQSTVVTTFNIIAESVPGDPGSALVIGAHLDSVPDGPGINDNGSGSATILEIALQLARIGYSPRHQLRFVWFGYS